MLTSSGLNWTSVNTNPLERPAMNTLGRLSKMVENVLTPFLVGGGFLSVNGAFGAYPYISNCPKFTAAW